MPQTASRKTLQGILLLIGALAAFTVLDATAKVMVQSLPQAVVVFFRYFIAMIFALALVGAAGGMRHFRTHHPYLQALRGFLLLGSTLLNFIALSYLQLAQTAAIAFTVPLWVCALSAPLLGEHVGLRRWLAVIIGFLGVLIIMRPGSASFHWAMLLSLLSTLMGSLYNLATRRVGVLDGAETSLFYVSLFGGLGALFPLALDWQLPMGSQWWPLVVIGFMGAFGHFLLIQAHRLAPASVLAPFTYTQIIWMIIAGWLLFGTLPDAWTLVGAGIVVASGIYVFAREQALGKLQSVPDPGD